MGAGGQFSGYHYVNAGNVELFSVGPSNMSSSYGPTSNATKIRSTCYKSMRTCIISGIGTTKTAMNSGATMSVWTCPACFDYAECFLNVYGYANARGFVQGDRVIIWNDSGSQIPSGTTFVFSATYFTAS